MNYSQFMSYDDVLEYNIEGSEHRRIILRLGEGHITLHLDNKSGSWHLTRPQCEEEHICKYKTLGKVYDHIINTYLPKINDMRRKQGLQLSEYYSLPLEERAKRHQIPQPPVIESGVHDLNEPWRPSFEDIGIDQLQSYNQVLDNIAKTLGYDKPRFATGDVVQINDIKLLINSHNATSGRYTVYPYVLGELISATTYHQNLIDTYGTKIYSLNESEED